MDVIAYQCLLLIDLFGETASGHLSIDVSNLITTGRHTNTRLSTEAPRHIRRKFEFNAMILFIFDCLSGKFRFGDDHFISVRI